METVVAGIKSSFKNIYTGVWDFINLLIARSLRPEELKRSTLTALWFMFLTFPILVIKVNTVDNVINWYWARVVYLGVTVYFVSFFWRYFLEVKEHGIKAALDADPVDTSIADGLTDNGQMGALSARLMANKKFKTALGISLCAFAVAFPFMFSMYQTNIMTNALMYIVLGLGLNIVVGLAGLLDLGYVAFYAVGAYCYALLNLHFGLGFWAVLPIGAVLGATCGLILGFPVLRLRGDYLAIVTLGFGEIIRLVLQNWNEFSHGPSGIANIPRPGFFGIDLSLKSSIIYMYFIMIGLCLLTIFVVNRLQHSRIGRAWVALREDEIACQAMGIDKTKIKLTAFALGATWAGMVGVVFAAKSTFINPESFTFMESAIILMIVVLGGMGTIVGVIIGAFMVILTPEYLRGIGEYRMLIFGATMVIMMVFRPQGIITSVRQKYKIMKDKT